jgi:hypothetical protein
MSNHNHPSSSFAMQKFHSSANIYFWVKFFDKCDLYSPNSFLPMPHYFFSFDELSFYLLPSSFSGDSVVIQFSTDKIV